MRLTQRFGRRLRHCKQIFVSLLYTYAKPMKPVPKFFNTAGPMKPELHYCIDPLTRFDLEEIESLIRQNKYFILHAPRQTGKTSCLLALRDYINKQGEFYAVYANVEGGQAMRNQVEEVIDGVIDIISFQLQMILKEEMPKILASQVKRNSAASVKLTEYLSLLCQKLDKPLLLFIDEIDALVGDSLVSVLRQLRSGYDLRPQAFPQSIILCGGARCA